MRFHFFDRCNMAIIKRKRLWWKFQSNNDWDRLESKHSIRKIYKNLNFLIFWTTFESFYIKRVASSEYVITRALCTKDIFPGNTSAIAHLYGCFMAELWVTEHWGSMKDFASFRMKKAIIPSMFLIEIGLCLFKFAICEFLQVKFSKS